MASNTRKQLEAWLKTISVKASSKVLDIGGSQNTVQSRLGHKGENAEYKILDLENPHEDSQQPDIACDLNLVERGIYGHNGLPLSEPGCSNDEPAGIYEIPIMKEYGHREEFDTAFCLEVMEYIYNPLQALKNINFFLKEDGILYISFPFIYGVHNPKGLDYLRYTPDGAEKLLKEAGFKILEHIPRTASSVLQTFYDIEGMRNRKDCNQLVSGSLIKCKKI